MTAKVARRRIVIYSLITCVIWVGFLIMSPLFVPLDNVEAFRLTQLIFPVFAGYLGTAVLFLTQDKEPRESVLDPYLLSLLIHGAFALFWFLGVVLFAYFYISNLPQMTVKGLQTNEVANYLTSLVALMNLTVGALTVFLFNSEKEKLAQLVSEAQVQQRE